MLIGEAIQVLGIGRDASLRDVQERRKLLVMVWHPDRFPAGSQTQARASDELKRINEAFDVLEEILEAGDMGSSEYVEDIGGPFCFCGANVTIDSPLIAISDMYRESQSTTLTLKRSRDKPADGLSLRLLTELDQETSSNAQVWGSCTSCTPCAVCGEPLMEFTFYERQTRIYRERTGTYSWTETQFTYLHRKCFDDYLTIIAEAELRAEREEQANRRAAQEARSEMERRKRLKLCLRCGLPLTFMDKIAGRTEHLSCPT